MSFGSGIVSSLKVVFDVEDGELSRGLDETDAKTRKSAAGMKSAYESLSNEQIKLKLAQDNLTKAVDRYGPSSVSAAKATIKLRDAEDALTRSQKTGQTATENHGRALGGMQTKVLGLAASYLGVRGLISAGRTWVDVASNVNEQTSKTTVVFGESAKGIQAWSDTTASSIGVAKDQALEAAGVFGNMLKPMGFAPQLAADMSQTMVKLAADMASFNNADPSETLQALRSGLAGEAEPLRRFGVFLSDATVKQEALTMGLYDGSGQLSANAKAAASYSLILKQTKDAQGDFARTSGGLANQQRILKAEVRDSEAKIGQALYPTVLKMTTAASAWLGKSENIAKVQHAVNTVVDTGGKIIGAAWPVVKKLAGAASDVVSAMGGWSTAFELVTGGLLARKVLGLAGAFGGEKGLAGGLYRATLGITGRGGLLGALRSIPASIPIAIAITGGLDAIKSIQHAGDASSGSFTKDAASGGYLNAAANFLYKGVTGEVYNPHNWPTDPNGVPVDPADITSSDPGKRARARAAWTHGSAAQKAASAKTPLTISKRTIPAPAAVDYSKNPDFSGLDTTGGGGGGGSKKKDGLVDAGSYGIDSAKRIWDMLMGRVDQVEKQQTRDALAVVKAMGTAVRTATKAADAEAKRRAAAAVALDKADRKQLAAQITVPGLAATLGTLSDMRSGRSYQQQTVKGIGKVLVPIAPTVSSWQAIQKRLGVKLKAALQRQAALQRSLKTARAAKFPNKAHIANVQAALAKITQTVQELRQDIGDAIMEIKQLNQTAADDAQKQADEDERTGQQQADQAMSQAAQLPAEIKLAMSLAEGTSTTADDIQALRGAEQYLQAELNTGTVSTSTGQYAFTTEARVQIIDELNRVRSQISQLQQAKDELKQITRSALDPASSAQEGLAFLMQLRNLRGYQDNLLPRELRGSTITVVNNFAQAPSDPGTFVDSLQFELKALAA